MKREKILLLCMAFVMMVITSFSMIQPTYALGPDTYDCRICGTTHDVSELAYTQKIAIEWHDILYSADWFGDKESGATLSTEDVLRFDGGTFSTVWTKGQQLYDYIVPVGILLCLMYTMMELMEQSTTDRISPENVVRTFTKLIIGFLLVQNGFEICSFTIGISSTAVEAFVGQYGINQPADCLYNAVEYFREDFCTGALSMSETMLPYIIVLITKLVISVICWTRILDIMIRVILAPIGMSDIIVQGTKGSGWAFFKRLLVSGLQGLVILGIMYAYSIILRAIQSNAVDTNLPSYGLAVILAVVTLLSVLKSQTYAQEIVG